MKKVILVSSFCFAMAAFSAGAFSASPVGAVKAQLPGLNNGTQLAMVSSTTTTTTKTTTTTTTTTTRTSQLEA